MNYIDAVHGFFRALVDADYFWVGVIGLFVGTTELLSRYRDDPRRALLNGGATLYVLVNVAAACITLFLARDVFHWDFAVDAVKEPVKLRWITVLVAGLGAMAFFRSSLFVFRVGDKDVPLGPGIVLQVLLDVTDRAVDRSRARPRAAIVANIMQGVDFSKAEAALPTYCFALMQNVSADEQATFGLQVARLGAASSMSGSVKTLALGLALMNLVGDAVLKVAVDTLGKELRNEPDSSRNDEGQGKSGLQSVIDRVLKPSIAAPAK